MSTLLEEIYQKYRNDNRAFAVMLELTYRCLCRCVHCYIDDYTSPEMSTNEIIALLGELRDEGVFDLGLTGGEIFLRADLPEILKEAKRLGFLTYILTTGILIDDAAADMLKLNNVHHAEISIMGATAATHDAVMRRPGAFEAMMNGVKRLKDREIPVVLKNSVLRQNFSELSAMAELADSLGLPFNASLSVLPKIGGNSSPQDCAVDLATATSLDPALMNGGLLPGEESGQGVKLACNAGKTICGISPDGTVYPCLIWRMPLGNVKTKSFKEIWHGDMHPGLAGIRTSRAEDATECNGCGNAKTCRRCPGLAFAETGDYLAPVTSACILAGKKIRKGLSLPHCVSDILAAPSTEHAANTRRIQCRRPRGTLNGGKPVPFPCPLPPSVGRP